MRTVTNTRVKAVWEKVWMYLCSSKVLNGTAEIHPYIYGFHKLGDGGRGLNNCSFWFHMYSPLGVDLG